MKILLDNNLPKVKISNTETVHCSLYNFQKKTDEGLFLACKYEKIEALMTKDKDFDDLVNLFNPPPKIIRLTCGNLSKKDLQNYVDSKNVEILAFLKSDNNLLIS